MHEDTGGVFFVASSIPYKEDGFARNSSRHENAIAKKMKKWDSLMYYIYHENIVCDVARGSWDIWLVSFGIMRWRSIG